MEKNPSMIIWKILTWFLLPDCKQLLKLNFPSSPCVPHLSRLIRMSGCSLVPTRSSCHMRQPSPQSQPLITINTPGQAPFLRFQNISGSTRGVLPAIPEMSHRVRNKPFLFSWCVCDVISLDVQTHSLWVFILFLQSGYNSGEPLKCFHFNKYILK